MHVPDRHELNAGWTLPETYGVDRLVLLPKDPHSLFAYWEVTPALENKLREQYGDTLDMSRLVLRIHYLDFGGITDIDVNSYTNNWYLHVNDADSAYRVELGRLLPDGNFVSLLVSNTIQTPRDSISSVIDPRWKMFNFWQNRYVRRPQQGGYSSLEFLGIPSSAEFNESPTGGEIF